MRKLKEDRRKHRQGVTVDINEGIKMIVGKLSKNTSSLWPCNFLKGGIPVLTHVFIVFPV